MTRWESFPISEQEQAYLASTTTAATESTAAHIKNYIRHRLGGFIRQEVSETGQTICFYRYNSVDTAIPYMCELGCCNHGCCTVSDIAARSTSFGWAIALLIMVLISMVFAVASLLTVWLMNRYKDKMHRQQVAESIIASSSVSQISGPTSFYPDVQMNHHLHNEYKSY
uniref:CX domain-containing protein n=1 Tax=Caenorhabditis japonica TaxID=281687 RepID=A0A8R1I1C9_CAEJA